VLCASFVVQSISKRLFLVNASVSQASVHKSFLRPTIFCARDFSLTARAVCRADTLISARTRGKQLRRTYLDDMWEEMGWDEKSWDEVRWGEESWDEVRWGEKSSDEMRWDEMTWSVECEVQVWSVKSAAWSVRKVFAWRCIAPGSCAGHVLGQHLCNSFAQSTHARAWLAHGACKFYRGKRSYSISLTQLPPRLVRVLLVSNHVFFCHIQSG